MWHQLLRRFGRTTRPSTRNAKRRRLRMEVVEKRQLMASDLGVIAGVAFIDQNNDGSPTDDPPVLVDASGNLVAPGTPGASGIQIQLFEDTNGDDLFDGDDQLAGTAISGLDGSYRFDQLSPGTFFVQQDPVPQLQTPAPFQVEVVDDDGIQTQLIDSFSDGEQNFSAMAGTTVNNSVIGLTDVVGGGRDAQVINTAASGLVTFFADDSTGNLSIGSQGDATGTALIQYDGEDNSIVLDPDGLGGASLGGGAAGEALDPDAGLVILARGENAGDTLAVSIQDVDGGTSTTTLTLPQAPTGFVETFVRFSAFTAGADFNNVGSIEATVNLSANNDVFVSIVESITPAIVTTNLVNIQPVSLGGEIFIDNGDDAFQNDGTRQGTEPGLVGVTVQLFQLAGPDDVVDPDNQTPVATAITTAGGSYLFTDLVPGNYATVIPANQFADGATLFGFANSTGNDPAPDPDDNVDDDDNGTVTAGGDVISGTITLESNQEPADDDDTDANTNTTIDFGFFPQIDLQITKTLDEANSDLVAGGTAVFDIVVDNLGPLQATGVDVIDVLPDGLTFSGISNQSGTFTQTTNGNTTTIDIGNVDVGTPATFTLSATIDDDQFDELTNTATVATTDQVDVDPTNNSDDADVDLQSADLSIVKTDLVDPVNAGEQISYQITVTNNGPDDASGVVVRDTLPDGVTFNSGDVDGAANLISIDPVTGEIVGTVGALANGADSVITIIVDVDSDADELITNTATVTSDPNTDPDLSNNTTDEDTTILRQVDVSVVKNAPDNVTAGEDFTYEIVVSNTGPGEARDVSIVDLLDDNLTFVNGSLDAGTSGVTVSQTGQQLTFDVGMLDADETITFTFDVTVDSAATGTIDNTVTVSTSDDDTDDDNDTNVETVTVTQSVDLVLEKSVDLGTAVPGEDQLVFTFTVSHDADSPSDASNVVVTDVLPANVTVATITAPNADSTDFDVDTNTLTVNFDSIAVGETETFTVTVDIPEASTGTVVNSATVASDGTELDEDNNEASATTTLTPVFDVVVDKTVDDATPPIGGPVNFTVVLNNVGPSTATGVVLTDVVPDGLTFVSGTLDGNAGTLDAGTVSFPAITLDSGETQNAILQFTVDTTATGTITNTASVPDLSADGEFDVTNNSDSEDITIVPQADVTVIKAVSSDVALAGSTLTYTIDVTNNGLSVAEDVTLTDVLPAGVTFVSGTGPDGPLTAVGQTVTATLAELGSTETETFTIVATVNAGVTATQINTATVTTSTAESDTTNNSASASTEIDQENGSIAGTVFVDDNGNGIQDAGEVGIAGVMVQLTGTNSFGTPVNLTQTTDANGDYLFAQLARGVYTLTQFQPAGFSDGVESAGTGATAVVGNDEFTDLEFDNDDDFDTPVAAVDFNFAELAATLSKRGFLASARLDTEVS